MNRVFNIVRKHLPNQSSALYSLNAACLNLLVTQNRAERENTKRGYRSR